MSAYVVYFKAVFCLYFFQTNIDSLNRKNCPFLRNKALFLSVNNIQSIMTIFDMLLKICKMYLTLNSIADTPEIIWDDITLQDEVEQSRAMLYRAQAEKIKRGE